TPALSSTRTGLFGSFPKKHCRRALDDAARNFAGGAVRRSIRAASPGARKNTRTNFGCVSLASTCGPDTVQPLRIIDRPQARPERRWFAPASRTAVDPAAPSWDVSEQSGACAANRRNITGALLDDVNAPFIGHALRLCAPRSPNLSPEPTTRSFTVLDTTTS